MKIVSTVRKLIVRKEGSINGYLEGRVDSFRTSLTGSQIFRQDVMWPSRNPNQGLNAIITQVPTSVPPLID